LDSPFSLLIGTVLVGGRYLHLHGITDDSFVQFLFASPMVHKRGDLAWRGSKQFCRHVHCCLWPMRSTNFVAKT
jgi:hypothetical protein